jgi:hypothetical protein
VASPPTLQGTDSIEFPTKVPAREAKEAMRKQVLTHQPQQSNYANLPCEAQTQLVKAKKAAGRKLMEKPKDTAAKSNVKKVVKRKGKTKTKNRMHKEGQKPKAVNTEKTNQGTSNKENQEPADTQLLVAKTVQLGGCLHCDLNGLLSFTKSNAKWYMEPNRFLANMYCKDCHMSVANMVTKTSSRAMLFYCDQGIKGFDAPDDDPMKEELTCDLVLCPPCEGKRRINYDKVNTGRGGRRQSRKR